MLCLILSEVLCYASGAAGTENEKKDDNLTEQETSVSQIEANMDEYLLGFKKKLQDATKGSDCITLEQAQTDFGNLLNFDFGDANYETNVYQYDTINIKLEVSQNQIDLSQLALIYKEAVQNILGHGKCLLVRGSRSNTIA